MHTGCCDAGGGGRRGKSPPYATPAQGAPLGAARHGSSPSRDHVGLGRTGRRQKEQTSKLLPDPTEHTVHGAARQELIQRRRVRIT